MSAAVVLAAGASTRMGSPKGLQKVAGKTLLEMLVRTLHELRADPIVVVVGADAESYHALQPPHGFRYLIHGDWNRGRTSSVKAGLHALGAECRETFLWPVDHPFVKAETLRRLQMRGSKRKGSWIVPRYAGKRGHPPLLTRSAMDAVLQYRDDDPLHRYLRENPKEVVDVDVSDPAVLENVDTPQDLAHVLSSQNGSE